MSTKIYSGVLFTTNDLRELHQHLMQLREVAQPLMEKLYFDQLLLIAVQEYDRICLGHTPEKEKESSFIRFAERSAWDILDKHSLDIRSTPYDTETSITIHPIKDKILGIPFGRTEFLELVREQPFVAPYGYWDNTDQEEGVSDEDWERRGEDWEEALGRNWVPSLNGFTAEITRKKPSLHKIRNLGSLPTFEERCESTADVLALQMYPGEVTSNNWHDLFNWKGGDAYNAAYKVKLEEVSGKLHRDVELSHLLEKTIA